MISDFFKLHSANAVVRGKDKSAVYKLNKAKILFIPNSLADLISELDKHPIHKVRAQYDPADQQTFDSYIDYLLKDDVGFITDTPDLFPGITNDYAIPNKVNNAIFEVSAPNDSLYGAFEQLEKLYCKHLELRFSLNSTSVNEINSILNRLVNSSFRSVSVFIKYDGARIEMEPLNLLYDSSDKIDFIMIHDFLPQQLEPSDRNIFFHQQQDINILTMAFPKDKYIINIEFFVESLQYNPYYNRKVCIDSVGNIKNCLLHATSFGNINDDSLETVVDSEAFQDLWHASHDKIIEYQDSELRYCMLVSDNLVKIGPDKYSVA